MYIKNANTIEVTRYELDQQQFPGMCVDAVPNHTNPSMIDLYLRFKTNEVESCNFMFGFTPCEDCTIESMIEGNLYTHVELLAQEMDMCGILPENLAHFLPDDDCGECDHDCKCGECDCNDCDCDDDKQEPMFANIPTFDVKPFICCELDQQKFPGLSVNVICNIQNPSEADVFLRHNGAEPYYLYTVNSGLHMKQLVAFIDSTIEECVAQFRKEYPDTTDDRIIAHLEGECPVEDESGEQPTSVAPHSEG